MANHDVLTQSLHNQRIRGLFQRIQHLSDSKKIIMIIGLAVLLRLVSAIIQGNQVTDLPGVYDQISYHGLALRVIDGNGFSFSEYHWPATRAGEPTAHWSYLYTIYLAGIYKLFGTSPLIARVIQASIAGVLQTFLFWRLGTRIFNRNVGLIAATLNAIYIYFFYYAGALVTETFYITGILWVFDTSLHIVHKKKKTIGWALWLELGLAISLTVLLRQVFLLFLPFLFIWIWWNIRITENSRWKQSIHWTAFRGLVLATVVLALTILPFSIRNYRVFGTFVLLNTNAGFAFYWGNHPIQGTHFVPILPATGPSYQDLIPPDLLSLNEGMLDKALLSEGIKIVLDDPVRYMLLSLSRIKEYIKFWPSQDSSMVSNISRVASFGIMLPFMLYGLFISVTKLRKPSFPGQGADIWILYLFIIIYTSIHLLTWTLIRYRLPIDAIMLIFAAVGIKRLTQIFHFW